METIEIDLNNSAQSYTVPRGGWTKSPKSYRCHIKLIKEEDGGYSAIVLNLPGTGSCGDTEEEALDNVREAASGVIESYLEDGEDLPWRDSLAEVIPDDARHMWILVHV